MKYYDSNGLEVDILQTDGGYYEAYVYEAQYIDSDDEVPTHELDYLTECYQEDVANKEYQKMVSRAEDIYEGDR